MEHRLWIDGAWTDSAGGERMTIENPATAEQIAEVVDASRADVDRAVQVSSDLLTWFFCPAYTTVEQIRDLGPVDQLTVRDPGGQLGERRRGRDHGAERGMMLERMQGAAWTHARTRSKRRARCARAIARACRCGSSGVSGCRTLVRS